VSKKGFGLGLGLNDVWVIMDLAVLLFVFLLDTMVSTLLNL
jgi:hypothetical protein